MVSPILDIAPNTESATDPTSPSAGCVRAIRAPALRALLLVAIALTAACTSRGAAHAETPNTVNCYDKARGMVSTTRRAECRGTIISDARAAEIRHRRHAYVKGSLERNIGPGVLGKKLVGIGSGFFVNARGTVLTSAHVVRSCSTLTLSGDSGDKEPARLKALDLALDLALLETQAVPARTAVFAPTDEPATTRVSIIGYPSKGLATRLPTLTEGAIGDFNLPTPRPGLLVLKAEVRPGNSGGPVLDEQGRVIGVVFAALNTPTYYAKTGQQITDLGYAIPNRAIQTFLNRHQVDFGTTRLTRRERGIKSSVIEAAKQVTRIECWL